MTFLPFLFYIILLLSFYSIARNYKQSIAISCLTSYVFSNLLLVIIAKLILILSIAPYSKLIFILIFFFLIVILLKFRNFLYLDLKLIKFKKNFIFYFFLLVAIYIIAQSLILPPANFDSLAYHIQRNYLFINENTLYPINNAHYSNQVFQPLNHDLFFYFFAVFHSNIFMNIYSITSYIIILILLKLIFDLLKIKESKQKNLFFIFFSFSSITLAMLTTKNDLVISAYALSCLYLFYDFIINKRNLSLIILILAFCFAIGIKWNFVFFAISLFPFFIFFLIKKKKIILLTKTTIYLIPILILTLPIEIIYLNYINTGNVLGPENYLMGNKNPDGLIGAISNYIRVLVSLFDITFPLQYLGIDSVNIFFKDLTNSILNFLFKSQNLGIANEIKWLEYSYEYTLKPHSDYTAYSITGFIVTLINIYYLFFGNKKILKLISLISLIFMTLMITYFTWQPWIMRFFMICMILNLIVSSEYIATIPKKIIQKISFFCILIFLFNILSNVAQPLIAHSNTSSWLNAFFNRDSYAKFSIPEMDKINNFIKINKKNANILIVIKKTGSQSPYEIMRKSHNNYFLFADKDFNNFFKKEYLGQKIKIDEKNFEFIINISDEDLEFKNFKLIKKKDQFNYQIFERKKT
jgi:hypothetical protein